MTASSVLMYAENIKYDYKSIGRGSLIPVDVTFKAVADLRAILDFSLLKQNLVQTLLHFQYRTPYSSS